MPLLVTLAALLALLFATAAATRAADDPPAAAVDPRAREALETAGLPYQVDDADFRLEYEVDGGRGQRVWVDSETGKLDQLEFRAVWSIGARGQGPLPPDTARFLLRENARMIVGAWQVLERETDYLVLLSAPVSASADAVSLQEVIEVIAYSTDRIEKQLSAKDEF